MREGHMGTIETTELALSFPSFRNKPTTAGNKQLLDKFRACEIPCIDAMTIIQKRHKVSPFPWHWQFSVQDKWSRYPSSFLL
jgi:hypothetical protein